MASLGGFVIHGNSARTLGRCLESLLAVSDQVVAIDSQSSDGSRELCAQSGVRSVTFPWRGFGAARAEARRQLAGHDYLFFLDSDEWLDAPSVEVIRRWRESEPKLPHYRLKRRDWAEFGGGRFLFRTETRVRLIRFDCGSWEERWIVHEAMPTRPGRTLEGHIEHEFAQSLGALMEKQEQYALLWAIRAHAEGRRPRPAFGRGALATLRNALLKGALFRGGLDGWRLSAAVARYHESKHRYLAAVCSGRFEEGTALFAQGRFEELFRWSRQATAGC